MVEKEDIYTLRINCKGKRTVGKAKKGISVENIIGLNKLKTKIIEKRKIKMEEEKQKGKTKENATELQKPNAEAEVYNNNKKCDWIYTYTYTPISKIKTVQQKIQ